MFKIEKENIFIMILAIILLIIVFAIIKNFLVPLIFTFILTYILNPLYKKALKYLKSQEITSLIFSFLILFLILIPLFLMILNLTKEINNIDTNLFTDNLNLINDKIKTNYDINLNLVDQYKLIYSKIKEELHNFFFKLPSYLFQIFLIVFFYYYFSKDYNYEIRFFRTRFNPKNYTFIKNELEKLISGIIYGQIFVRLIQALVAIFGFIIIGLNGAIIYGILIFFSAFLPIIGTGIVWLPLAIIKIINHEYYLGIMIIIIGTLISTIDNILLPYIISEKTNMGPVLTLISILGGLQLLGLYGIILGPFFVGMLFIIIEDILNKLKKSNPEIQRYTWSEEERKKFKSLKTDIAKDKYIEMLNKKYSQIYN